jgi:hypothetical protein
VVTLLATTSKAATELAGLMAWSMIGAKETVTGLLHSPARHVPSAGLDASMNNLDRSHRQKPMLLVS